MRIVPRDPSRILRVVVALSASLVVACSGTGGGTTGGGSSSGGAAVTDGGTQADASHHGGHDAGDATDAGSAGGTDGGDDHDAGTSGGTDGGDDHDAGTSGGRDGGDDHDAGNTGGTDAGGSSNGDGGTAGTDAGTSSDGGTAAVNVPGTHQRELVVDGLTRRVIIYVPQNVQGPTPVSVVFMFHGSGGTGSKFFNISRWREKADAEGFIAVFPTGLEYCYRELDGTEDEDPDGTDPGSVYTGPNGLHVKTKWAEGKLGDPTRQPLCTADEILMLPEARRPAVDHPLADDVKFVDEMLNLLETGFAVNSRRIYASGFSNGGNFTSRLMLERSNRFAGLAAASGSLQLTPALAERALSAVISVGQKEPGIMSNNGGTPLPMTSMLLNDVPFLWNSLNPTLTMLGLSDAYTYDETTISGAKVSRFTFSTSTNGGSNTLRFLVVENLQHQYPNGTNNPVVAANVLWNVFRDLSLP